MDEQELRSFASAYLAYAMRADWERNAPRLMVLWSERSEDDHRIARGYFGDPAEPWALTEFGMPE